MHEKTSTPFCVVCKTHTRTPYVIPFSNGTHICMNCAEDIHDIVEMFHDMLEDCSCPHCCNYDS